MNRPAKARPGHALAAALAALVLLVLSLPLPVRAQVPITVSQQDIATVWQDTLTFTVKARSSAPITDIALKYSTTRAPAVYNTQNMTVSGGREAEATATISIAGNRYIPPGTLVRYFFRIKDAAGAELVTETYHHVYRDTRFVWQSVANGTVTVWYRAESAAYAEQVLRTAVQAADRISGQLGVRLREPVNIVIYTSQRELDSARIIRNEELREFAIGVAFIRNGAILLGPDRASQLGSTVTHEMAHFVIHEASDGATSSLPVWLNEGLAEYLTPTDRSRALRQDLRDGPLTPLRKLQQLPTERKEAERLYNQGEGAVRWLVSRHGISAIAGWLGQIRLGKDYDEAIEGAFGFDGDTLEADWRANLGVEPVPPGRPPKLERPTPGPVPTFPPIQIVQGTPSEAGPGQTRAIPPAATAAGAGALGAFVVLAGTGILATGHFRRSRSILAGVTALLTFGLAAFLLALSGVVVVTLDWEHIERLERLFSGGSPQ